MILPKAAPTSFRNRLRLLPQMVLFGALASVWSWSATAQEAPRMVLQSGPESAGNASGSATGFPQSNIFGEPAPEDIGVGGMGLLGRVGHVAGDTVGRSQSITYLDLSPYMFVEDTYIFSQGSLLITNQGKMGGTAGVGIRQYFSDRDFVLGVSGFYDHDETRDVRFQQAGVSVELFSQWMDVRANWYKPFGELVQEQGTSITPNSARFQGNNIVFATQTRVSAAADGVDLLFTVPVPGEVAQSVNLEASAGVYNFQALGEGLDHALGWRLRLDADFMDRLVHGFAEITKDQVFDTDLIVGVDVNYYGHLEDRPRFGSSQINRIAQWVRRSRTVVTIDSTRSNGEQVAINPNTNDPYFLYHVRNVPGGPLPNFPAPAGTGAIESPFQFIEEAQAALPDGDLIFVHADSVYDGRDTIQLNDGELILGEASGLNQTLPVVFGGGTANLAVPRATAGTNRPVISNSVGPAVQLADNNLFAGFDIQSPVGAGIVGNGINGGTIRDVRVNNTVGPNADGVSLINTSGNITLQDVDITSVDGNSFFVSGGSANITHSGVIQNDTGFAVLVQNNLGSVSMGQSIVTDIGGLGVGIFNSQASTTLGQLTLNNIAGPAFQVINVSGANSGVTLSQDVVINNPGGAGVLIQDFTSSFSGAGHQLTINNRGGVGIDLETINRGTAAFDVIFGDVDIDGTTATGTHGVDFQDSAGFVSFQSLSVTDSNTTGVNIGGTNQNTGRFLVNGPTSISNATDSSIRLAADASTVEFNGINIDSRGARGIEVFDHVGTARFAGLVTISNENLVLVPAIDVQRATQSVIFGTVSATDTRGLPGVRALNNPGSIGFTSLDVTSSGNTAVLFQENAILSVNGGVLDATAARALTMIDNPDFDVTFDEINSTNSDFGIFIENLVDPFDPADPLLPRTVLDRSGDFTVSGTGTGAVPGGTISGHTTAGAHFLNLDSVTLNGQEYTGNVIGVEADVVNEVSLVNLQVTDNTSFGFDGLDVFRLDVTTSLFQSNEGFNQLRYLADRTDVLDSNGDLVRAEYVVNIQQNQFIDDQAVANVGGGDMISVQTTANVTGEGPELFMLVADNGDPDAGGIAGFTSNRAAGDAIIGIVWRGDLGDVATTGVTIDNNNFLMSANAGQVGVGIRTTRQSTNRDSVVYTNNTLNDGGGGTDVGLDFDFAGATTLLIADNFGVDANGNFAVNGFQMDGLNALGDVAMDLTFRAANNEIEISTNAIGFTSTDGTGILFDAITGASNVTIEGNQIVMFDDFILPVERGIFFNRVVGSINLIGNVDNVISNSTQPFFINAGVSTGSILVNGQTVP